MSFAKYPVTGGSGGGISGPGTTTNNGLVLWDGLDGTTVKDGGVGSADQVLISSGTNVSFGLVGNANIGASAAIDYSKLATLTADRALVSSGSGFVSASSVTTTELGLLSGRSTGLVDTASNQTVGGVKTFSNEIIVGGGSPAAYGVFRDSTAVVVRGGGSANPDRIFSVFNSGNTAVVDVTESGSVVFTNNGGFGAFEFNRGGTGGSPVAKFSGPGTSAILEFAQNLGGTYGYLTVSNAKAFEFQGVSGVVLESTQAGLVTVGLSSFTGTHLIYGSARISNTTNQLVMGTTNTTTISATAPSASRVYTIPDVGANSDIILSAGTQTFTGDKTFSGALVIPASITMGANTFARSGAHNLTLTTAGATNVTLPTSGTLAILGANTFTAAQTITASSNQLVLHSGVNQLTLDSGTSAAARTYSFPDVGTTGTVAMLQGAQTFAGAKTFSSGLVVSGGSAANGALWFASNVLRQRGGTSGWAVDNTSGTAIISATDAGAVTLGPASGSTLNTNHLTRGAQRLATAQYAVDSGGATTETTPTTIGNQVLSVATTFTNLSTSARNVANSVALFQPGIHSFVLINIDGDQASFQVSVGLEEGIAYKFSPITGSNANCSISGTSTLSITGLGDGRTYTLTFNTGSGAATLAASSTATGTTTLHVHSVRRY